MTLTAPTLRRQISASDALASEVVLVPERLTNADVEALSVALHAEAVPIGDSWRLVRHQTTLQELRRSDGASLKREIAAAIGRYSELSSKYAKASVEAPYAAMKVARAEFETREHDQADESGVAAREVSPAARLLVDLLRSLPGDALDGVGPGREAVFSNAPIGSEKPLGSIEEVLGKYEADQRKFADWSMAAISEGKIPEAYQWAFPSKEFSPGARTIQLYVQRRTSQPIFALTVYDRTGAAEAGAMLPLLPQVSGPAGSPSKGSLGKARLPASESGSAAATDDLDPLSRDPLDGVVRQALLLWGRAKGFDSVVACVPDSLLAQVQRCIDGDKIDLDLLSAGIEAADCETIAQAKILILRPRHPLQEEARRVDRRPLSALCRTAAKGTFGLDDLIAYHAAYADTYDYLDALPSFERPIRDRYSLGRSLNWTVPHPVLATLGKLSVAERSALFRGIPVPLGSAAFDNCLPSLARLASYFSKPVERPRDKNVVVYRTPAFASATGSDLERSPRRLLARSSGNWISAASGPSSVLVRRVTKDDGQIVDENFIPLGFAAAGLETWNATGFQTLDRMYRLIWTQERTLSVWISLESAARLGPFVLRERFGGSRLPVSLGEIPSAPHG